MGHVEPSDRRKQREPLLGNLLKSKRESAGLSQDALAARLGVSRPYLSRLEHGEYTHPSGRVLTRIAECLDVTADDLYAITGYLLPTDLPSFSPYMRAKHPTWPETVLKELEDYYHFIKHKYSL